MKRQIFFILLLLVALLGLILRLVDYDRTPPFLETKDEFFYPWAGISFLQTGNPQAWSPFMSYSKAKEVNYWGEQFRMVSPWLEKPPLYSLLTGMVALLARQDDFHEVRLSTIRLVPIILNTITIIGIGLLAAVCFTPKTGIIAALLYATTPMIVLGNRLSLVENLLIPISIFTLFALFYKKVARLTRSQTILVGIGCALAVLTKQSGLALPAAIFIYLFSKKDWPAIILIGVITGFGAIIHPLMGLLYDWNIYIGVTKEYQQALSLGLPETLMTLFRFPVVGHKEKLFFDGTMLLGYIVFFASPFILKKEERTSPLLFYPFLYILLLSLLEGGQTWFGWHVFPLYPFLMIFLANIIRDFWHSLDLTVFILFVLTLITSSIRFGLLMLPQLHNEWQNPLIFISAFVIAVSFIPGRKPKQLLFAFLLLSTVLVNVLAAINLPILYGSLPQPRF